MNVAYFTTKANTNLVMNQVIMLIKEIREHGANVILYSFEDEGVDYSQTHLMLENLGIPFHSIDSQDIVNTFLRSDNINIIHCRSYDMAIIAAARFRFCKIIFDVRGLLPYEIFQMRNDYGELQTNLAGERKLVELSNAIVCVTKGMVDYFREQYGAIGEGKLVEIPVHYCHYNGAARSTAPKERLSEEYKWATFAGSLVAYYRLDNIFKLFYQLREKDGGYKLLILSNQDVRTDDVMGFFDFKVDPELFDIYSVVPELIPYYLSHSRIALDPFFTSVQLLNRVRLAVKTVEYIKYDLPIVAPDYYPVYKDLRNEGYPVLLFNEDFEIDFSDYDNVLKIKPNPAIKLRYDIKSASEKYIGLYRDLIR